VLVKAAVRDSGSLSELVGGHARTVLPAALAVAVALLALTACVRPPPPPPATPVELPTDALATAWSADDWKAIADLVAANWVRDLADDLAHAAERPGDAGTPARAALATARAWWEQRHGPAGDFRDRAWLEAQPRAPLEALGRRLRAAWLDLDARGAVEQWPRPPGHPRPSDTPFGDAITVKKNPPEDVAVAYHLQLEYTQAALAIEEAVDAGAAGQATVPFAQVVEYRRAQDVVRPRDYTVLARHQIAGMRRFFAQDALPRRRLADALWTMTVAGNWEHSKHSLARWLKWIDAWQTVRADGRVPDLVDPALLAPGSATPEAGGK